MTADDYASKNKPERPGCVTAYAILLWIGSGLAVIGIFCAETGYGGFFGGPIGIFEICLGLFFSLLLALGVAAGIGIWQMRKWGWALVLVLQTLSIITSTLSALALLAGSNVENAAAAAGNLLGLMISGYIIYWFITNRALFNGGAKVQTAVAPGGESVYKPVEKSNDRTIAIVLALGGAVAILVLVCIVVIAMLAILGPEIGNVFSQITFALEEPTPGLFIP